MDDEYGALIHGAYVAAMDDGADGWLPWLQRASDWVGGYCGFLGMVDRGRGALAWNAIHHPDPVATARYRDEGIYLLDPQVPVVARLERSRLYRDIDVLDFDDPMTRRHVDWTAEHAGMGHFASMAAVIGDGRWVGGLSIHNAVGRGVTSDAQWRRLAALSDTLERALSFGVLHAEKLREQWWTARLAATGEPAALLDESGAVLRMTADFEAAVARGDGLRVRGGRLVATDWASQRRLSALIERATVPGGAAADATQIERDADRPSYVLCAWPLPQERRSLVPDHAAALVTLLDPEARPAPARGLWCAAFGLTAREGDVAKVLVDGLTPDEAAAMLGVSIATVRVHMRQLFAKTQTTRQSQLIRILTRF
ncbi:helix-turn-helix transcriptional regulator [Sphingomonas phyllosphaerae]|uniref:helix-turn-helix transcriptional regulator n=1 Tax=Sphingomonas phyllosphaerae TaxID=257003 RepID=UPI0003B5B41A|nr:helix-turn-helix transcriptional regulator [Sphingomonas phyllosphaerae]